MELAGATPMLKLQLEASEPTGVLLDRLLGRTDRPPLTLSVDGTGPLADWRGHIFASAGTLAQVNADLTLAVASQTVLGLTGTAALAPLLPPDFAPLVGNRLALSLHGTFGERVVLDALSVEIAAGTLTGDAAFGGSEKAVAARVATASSRAATRKLSSVAEISALGPAGPRSATLPCAFRAPLAVSEADREVSVNRSRSPTRSACNLVRTAPVAKFSYRASESCRRPFAAGAARVPPTATSAAKRDQR
jgi:autotransporter translocation and assembly factor TamB